MPELGIGWLILEIKSMSYRSLALCALVLSAPLLFGLGCRARPRIVQAPTKPTEQTQTTESAPGVLAYARLNGSTADLTRDNTTAPLQDGQAVAEGDQIKVHTGTLELVYPDAGVSQVETGSEIVLLAQSDAPREGEVSTDIQLIAGSVWTRFERLLGNTERFSVTSNGVVATVRGTAFGVSADTDGVDVQVADHQVEVTEQQAEEQGLAAKSSVVLQANQGLKVKQGVFTTPAAVRRLIRSLNTSEKARAGFTFGANKLQLERLRRPAKIIPLLKLPRLPEAYRRRVEFLRKREAARRELLRFGTPTSTPDLNPTIDPSATGPGVNVETKATLFLNGKAL